MGVAAMLVMLPRYPELFFVPQNNGCPIGNLAVICQTVLEKTFGSNGHINDVPMQGQTSPGISIEADQY